MLADHVADVLVLDIYVPTSPENNNSFPFLHIIPRLLKKYPDLNVLVISMLTQRTLIEALVEAGVSGYIFKGDQTSFQQLAKIVSMVANGGAYFSQDAKMELRRKTHHRKDLTLTARQLEVLSLCAAYPDSSTEELAGRLGIASSTIRNLLSRAYLRLEVRTRAAAIAELHRLGLIAAPVKVRKAKRSNS
jgi:DNA-binding NarL/FixJ family response regulator